MQKLFSGLGITVGVLLILAGIVAVHAFLYSWAIMTLWGWFVVPLFGLAALTGVQAFGLLLVGTILTGGFGKSINQRFEDTRTAAESWASFIGLMLRPVFLVVVGWFGTLILA